MGGYTDNLNLYTTNMDTDGDDLFNFFRDLDDNWQKIDTATGKLSNLTTTQKDNIVAAINEVNGSISNAANKSLSNLDATGQAIIDGKANTFLSNLDTTGENRLHALKSYEDKGESLSDVAGFSNVIKYAHSTFDSSKFAASDTDFTVVGSPKISSDGILTESSVNNYVKFSVGSLPSYWSVTETVTTPALPASGQTAALFVKRSGQNNAKVIIRIENSQSKLVIGYYNASSTYTSSSFNIEANTQYTIDVNAVGANLTVALNGVVKVNVTDLNTSENIDYISIGSQNDGNAPWLGSIDLKTVAINVEGAFYSGNKTGNDTVISSDYTIAGSPVITNNNVVSGFSASNYLTKNLNLSGKSLKVRIPFMVTDNTKTQILLVNTYFQARLLYAGQSTALYASAYITDGNDLVQPRTGTYAIQTNTNYVYELEYITGVKSKVRLYAADGTTLIDASTDSPANVVIPDAVLTTKIGDEGANNYLTGNIKLADFKVETDTTVYRPYLQIPYIRSKTGAKVVNAVYKDRVDDLYKIEGFAPYYVLDESNSTFQLPQGDLYGMFQHAGKKERPDITTGISIVSPYTTEADGSIYVDCEGFANGTSLTCTIDGVQIQRFENDVASGNIASSFWLSISKGQTFTATLTNPQTGVTQVITKFYKSEGIK